MITIEETIPTDRIQLRRADGTPLQVAENATAQISFERVTHPLATPPRIAIDEVVYVRIEHRFKDLAGDEHIFTSHVPAMFFWEQLYVCDACTDVHAMIEWDLCVLPGPWQEQVLVESISDYSDLRHHRAFRVRRPEHEGYPDVVPLFTKHLSWTGRLSLVTVPLQGSETVTVLIATFLSTRTFTALREIESDTGEGLWKEVDLEPPFHVWLRPMDLLWRNFEEPEMDKDSWKRTRIPLLCTATKT